MTTHRVLLSILVATILAAQCASSRASTVYTESFETTLAGTLSGDVAVHDNTDYFGQATDGTHFLAFNQNNSDVGVQNDSFTSSNIATLSGYLYTLTFDYGMFNGTGPQTLTVSATDTVTSSPLTLAPSPNITDSTGTIVAFAVMSPYSFTFTGSGNPIALEFLDTTSNPSFNDGLLDHVVLTVNPEPASLGLLGIGSLLLTKRRRSR